MDINGLITELLKQNRFITPLEQDILDTWNELLPHWKSTSPAA